MSLSKVIKSSRQGGEPSILVTRPPGERPGGEGGFHSFSSLWQSADTELVAAVSELEAERERLRQEIEATRAETAGMVAAAKSQVEQIEGDARARGFAAGKAEAEAEERARLAEFAAELASLLAGIESDRLRIFSQYESEILALIKAMVDRVLFHEVTVNPQVIEVCLKTALSYVVENSSVTIRLHGQDLERLRQAAMERPEILGGHRKIELSEDPSLSPGGCLLETGFGEIDATLESRRDKVCAAIDAVLKKAASMVK